ncbi:uncharacterized protein LOC124450937 [Xenia sp. Carnegie-2017]|uniref:uncharacterized protein LOC124450937 n=1 Tax=Xenia sp. Carnegie-2017 TaxID=2897299 RepID=UPI001F03359A|nr:uncharacterized protein LOC124450937 [Xenia sp. Carnegie-2017]
MKRERQKVQICLLGAVAPNRLALSVESVEYGCLNNIEGRGLLQDYWIVSGQISCLVAWLPRNNWLFPAQHQWEDSWPNSIVELIVSPCFDDSPLHVPRFGDGKNLESPIWLPISLPSFLHHGGGVKHYALHNAIK